MKTIPKRLDLYTNPTQKNSNMEKQMSELLQIKNLLNCKLNLLTQSIANDTFSFASKYNSQQQKNINVLNLEKSLFGNDRNFSLFSIDFKKLLQKIQSEVKGVVEVLEKFSFTKNISLFITDGILSNFLQINSLMLKRQQIANNFMKKIHQNVLNGNGIFSKKYAENTVCVKCHSNVQKEKIISTKESILLGGPRISDLYKNLLQEDSSSEQEFNTEANFYDRIGKIKKKVRKQFGDHGKILSEQDMNFNLERLQNNLQQRKYDILACLIQMGQFGSELIKSTQQIQKAMQQNSFPKETNEISSVFSPVNCIPSKFNHKEFTFNIGKYFSKGIKDIEMELSDIKNKYKTLLASQLQHQNQREIQCDLGREQHERQMEKYRAKMQRQVIGLNGRIKQIQELNKSYKGKIEEYDNAIKVHISSRMDKEMVEVGKITVQKKIARLVDNYEKKLSEQQKELKKFRQSKLKSQTLSNSAKFPLNNKQSSYSLIPNQNSENNLQEGQVEDRWNTDEDNDVAYHLQKRKNVSLFLQPKIKRFNNTPQHQIDSKKQLHSLDLGQNHNLNCLQQTPKLASENNLSGTINQLKQNYFEVRKIRKSLKIQSKVVEIYLFSHQNILNQYCLEKENTRHIQRKHSKVLHPTQMQILKKQTNLSQFQRQYQSKFKLRRASKLGKVKSQQNTKSDIIDHSYEEKLLLKQPKKIEITNDISKRYASEHAANIIQRKVGFSHTRNTKQKPTKKVTKTVSLNLLKKGQQQSGIKSSLKLPSILQQEKCINKLQKLKHMQKSGMNMSTNNKSSLLTKKKPKKRHFSQQELIMDLFDSQQMTMSLGGNVEKQGRQKTKKEYIIDFIPMIEEESASKCKDEQFQMIQNQIQGLFDVADMRRKTVKTQNKDAKLSTKARYTMVDSENMQLQRLKKQEISLSTSIYSAMAAIKSKDCGLYKSIREKLKNEYEKLNTIKTNCDHISLNLGKCNNITQIPLSLSLNPSLIKDNESPLQLQKVHQTISTNLNQEETQNSDKKLNISEKNHKLFDHKASPPVFIQPKLSITQQKLKHKNLLTFLYLLSVIDLTDKQRIITNNDDQDGNQVITHQRKQRKYYKYSKLITMRISKK